jgi:hypothetical protein
MRPVARGHGIPRNEARVRRFRARGTQRQSPSRTGLGCLASLEDRARRRVVLGVRRSTSRGRRHRGGASPDAARSRTACAVRDPPGDAERRTLRVPGSELRSFRWQQGDLVPGASTRRVRAVATSPSRSVVLITGIDRLFECARRRAHAKRHHASRAHSRWAARYAARSWPQRREPMVHRSNALFRPRWRRRSSAVARPTAGRSRPTTTSTARRNAARCGRRGRRLHDRAERTAAPAPPKEVTVPAPLTLVQCPGDRRGNNRDHDPEGGALPLRLDLTLEQWDFRCTRRA